MPERVDGEGPPPAYEEGSSPFRPAGREPLLERAFAGTSALIGDDRFFPTVRAAVSYCVAGSSGGGSPNRSGLSNTST